MLEFTSDTEAPALDVAVLSPPSKILKMARLLNKYKLIVKCATAMALYASLGKKSQAKHWPVAWLIDRWFENEDKALDLTARALSLCQEYKETDAIPKTVRHMCMEFGIPIRYLSFVFLNLKMRPH